MFAFALKQAKKEKEETFCQPPKLKEKKHRSGPRKKIVGAPGPVRGGIAPLFPPGTEPHAKVRNLKTLVSFSSLLKSREIVGEYNCSKAYSPSFRDLFKTIFYRNVLKGKDSSFHNNANGRKR